MLTINLDECVYVVLATIKNRVFSDSWPAALLCLYCWDFFVSQLYYPMKSRVALTWLMTFGTIPKWGHIIIKARLIYPRSAELFTSASHHPGTPSMWLEFRKVTKSLGIGFKVVYRDVSSHKKASDRTTPWWVVVIVRKFARALCKPQLNYVKVARMPSQLTDKPVSWQDSWSWSSQVQDHGSQGSMSVLNRSVWISVCNFVKLCFFLLSSVCSELPWPASQWTWWNAELEICVCKQTSHEGHIPHVFCLLKTMSSNYIMQKNMNYNNGWDNYVLTICWFMQPSPSWNFGNSFSQYLG